jgi:hypothetical protein
MRKDLLLDILPYPKGNNKRYDASYEPEVQQILNSLKSGLSFQDLDKEDLEILQNNLSKTEFDKLTQ